MAGNPWTEQALAAKGLVVVGNRAVPAPPAPRRHPAIAEQWADREDQRRESELQTEVEAWLAGELAAGRLLCFTHVRTPKKDRPGLPDLIIGLRPGLVVAVELKRPDGTGRLRPEQETWLRAYGSRGAVATSLEQVKALIRAWRVGLQGASGSTPVCPDRRDEAGPAGARRGQEEGGAR